MPEMKVMDLQCSHSHNFEGWFASEEDFRGQVERGFLACPVCGDVAVRKLPSASRLNLGAAAFSEEDDGAGRAAVDVKGDAQPAAQTLRAVQAAWMHMARKIAANTENVGERFAEEARRMHYGEAAERAIRGRVTEKQADELREEGIDVLPLPLPPGFDEPLQ